MSITLMSQVFLLKLQPSRKLVLLKIADRAGDDGLNFYESLEFVAARTGQGERTVRRIRKEFERNGVLVVTGSKAGRRGKINVFKLDIERAIEIYGLIDDEDAAKLATNLKELKNQKAAKSSDKAANSNATSGQSLAGDSSESMNDSSRAREAGAADGPPATARESDVDVGPDRQAMIAEFKGEVVPKIRAAVGEEVFNVFGRTLWRVVGKGADGRLILAQPSRLLCDMTRPHLDAIADATGMDVELIMATMPEPGSVGRGGCKT